MVRVIAVVDGRTLLVDRGGTTSAVVLGGIVITDPAAAKTLLEWNASTRWVMVESQKDGGSFVYRSPDALFLNRELVLQGFARATVREVAPESHVIVTYLGRVDPGRRMPAAVSPAPARENGNDASRRSPARRPRRGRRP